MCGVKRRKGRGLEAYAWKSWWYHSKLWNTGKTIIFFLDMLRLRSQGTCREAQTRQRNGWGWNLPVPVGQREIWAGSHQDRARAMELMECVQSENRGPHQHWRSREYKKHKQRKWERSQEKESHSLPDNSLEEKAVDGFKCHIDDLRQKWAVSIDIFNKKVTYNFSQSSRRSTTSAKTFIREKQNSVFFNALCFGVTLF